jgi:hypothetical protein
VIEFLFLHPILSLFAIGGMGGFVIRAFLAHQQSKRQHALAMAREHTRGEMAKALTAAPVDERKALAQELLAAHDEVERGLE